MKTNKGWRPESIHDAIGHEMKDNSGNIGELKNIYTDVFGWRFDVLFDYGLRTGLSSHDVCFSNTEWICAALCPECGKIRTVNNFEALEYYLANKNHINIDMKHRLYFCADNIIFSEGWTIFCPECNGREA